MSSTPFKQVDLPRSVLIGTAAEWATWQDVNLASYQTARESDTGKEKTGPGLFGDLLYDNPQGQTQSNTTGTPASTDKIAYTAITAAVAATSSWTCEDHGTADATIIVGSKLYTVVASGATGDQINAGANAGDYATNIANKITTDTASTLCTCVANGDELAFTANTAGAAGNDIPLSTNDDAGISHSAFSNGTDAVYAVKATSVGNLISNIITGTIDCSANPNYPSATKGAIYIVSVAGKIGGSAGVDVEVNDWIVCIITNAGGTQAGVGADWDIIQTNITRPTSGYTTTATAAGSTALVEGSTYQQFFTGVTTQTIVLPVATTLQLGWAVLIVNNSTGSLTVNSSGGNLVQTVLAGQRALITCIAITGTGAASWSSSVIPNTSSAGSPTFVAPVLGTPASGTLTSCTGLPVATGIANLGTGIATALAVNTGSAGAPVLFNGAGGTPSSLTGTNITGTASGLTAGAVTTNANLTGDVTSVGNTTTLTNAPVIAKVLTGFASGAGSVSAADSILSATQKLDGNIGTKQASLSGTFSLANFTDPGNGTASAALGGTIGTLIFGYVTYTPDAATTQTQTFQVETAIASAAYTTVQVSGVVTAATNVGGAVTTPFCFFVPTGRKWKHNQVGAAAVTSVSAIVL